MGMFVGKMSLMLTARYEQLVSGLTAVQQRAAATVRGVAALGTAANASLSNTPTILGHISQALLNITSGAHGAGMAIMQLGTAIKDMAVAREKASKQQVQGALARGGMGALTPSIIAKRAQVVAAAETVGVLAGQRAQQAAQKVSLHAQQNGLKAQQAAQIQAAVQANTLVKAQARAQHLAAQSVSYRHKAAAAHVQIPLYTAEEMAQVKAGVAKSAGLYGLKPEVTMDPRHPFIQEYRKSLTPDTWGLATDIIAVNAPALKGRYSTPKARGTDPAAGKLHTTMEHAKSIWEGIGIHEGAHVLEKAADLGYTWDKIHRKIPEEDFLKVSRYAGTNAREAFAESFTARALGKQLPLSVTQALEEMDLELKMVLGTKRGRRKAQKILEESSSYFGPAPSGVPSSTATQVAAKAAEEARVARSMADRATRSLDFDKAAALKEPDYLKRSDRGHTTLDLERKANAVAAMQADAEALAALSVQAHAPLAAARTAAAQAAAHGRAAAVSIGAAQSAQSGAAWSQVLAQVGGRHQMQAAAAQAALAMGMAGWGGGMRGGRIAQDAFEPMRHPSENAVGAGAAQMAAAMAIRKEAVVRGAERAAARQGSLAVLLAQAKAPLSEAAAERMGGRGQVAQLGQLIQKIEKPPRELAKDLIAARVAARNAPDYAQPHAQENVLNARRAFRAELAAQQHAKGVLMGIIPGAQPPGGMPPGAGGVAGAAGTGGLGAGDTALAGAAGGMGYGAMIGIGAAVTAIGLVTKVGADFEHQMARVKALVEQEYDSKNLGKLATDFQRLGDVAIQMGTKSQFSATQVAQGMAEFALAGFKQKEILDTIRPATLLATAGNMELGRATELLAITLRGFRLPASESARVVDILAYAANNSVTNLEQMGEALKYSMGVARTAGLTLEETAAAAMLLSDAGLQGSVAGTALRNMLKKTSDTSAEALAMMNAYGLKFADVTGKWRGFGTILTEMNDKLRGLGAMKKLEVVGSMLEIRAGTGFLTLLGQADQYDKRVQALQNSQGTAARMEATQMDTLVGDWKRFKGSIDAVALSFYDLVVGPLRGTIRALREVSMWFAGMKEGTWGQFGSVLGTKGALGGALSGAGVGATIALLAKILPQTRALMTVGGAMKTGGLLGGIWGGIKAAIGLADKKITPKADPYEGFSERSKKFSQSIEEAGMSVDVVAIEKLSKSLMELSIQIRENISALRASTEMSVQHFAVQAGGFGVLTHQAEGWKLQTQGLRQLADVQAEMEGKNKEVQPLLRIKGLMEGLKGTETQYENLEKLSKDGKNTFEEMLKDVDRFVQDKDSFYEMDLKNAFKRNTRGLEGQRKFIDSQSQLIAPFAPLTPDDKTAWPEIKQQVERMRLLHQSIGLASKMATGKEVAPGLVFEHPESTWKSQLADFEKELNKITFSPLMTKLRIARPEMLEGMQMYFRQAELKGTIDALMNLPAAANKVTALQAALAELGVTEQHLIGIGYRMKEVNDILVSSDAPAAVQNMIIQREAHRAEVMMTVESYKKMAVAQDELNRMERLGQSELANIDVGRKTVADLQRKVEMETFAARANDQAKRMNKTFGETRRPKEVFDIQAGGLLGELSIPADWLAKIGKARLMLKQGIEKKDPIQTEHWGKKLDKLNFGVKYSVQNWETFERAVRKTGKAMDDAMGGVRLPPVLLEGSAAAVSRINQYAAENDPNRAVFADINEVLRLGLIAWQASQKSLEGLDQSNKELRQSSQHGPTIKELLSP